MPTPTRTLIRPRAEPWRAHLHPLEPYRALWQHRHVLLQVGRRQVAARYRGSFLGVLWNLLNPLLLLLVYTLVFTELMPVAGDDKLGFVLRMFCGLLLFNLFSETVLRAPTAVLGNANYVKKVVFPLEVLPAADLYASSVAALMNLLVLLALLLATGGVPWTIVWLPLLLPPLLLATLGTAWLVAALGVYVRDLGASIGVLMMVLFFLTPIFYRLDDVQTPLLRALLQLNPLAAMIDGVRAVLLAGESPDWARLGVGWLLALLLCWVGFAWFRASKRGFADVV